MCRLSNYIILIIGLLLIGCTSYEAINEIHPEVTVIGEEVGLVYKFGDLTVSDTFKDLEEAKIAFLQTSKDIKFSLVIKKREDQNPTFSYYVNGILFKENINVLSNELILSQRDKIENFFLYKLNGTEFSEENKEEIKEKLEDIKKEVNEKGKTKGKFNFNTEDRY